MKIELTREQQKNPEIYIDPRQFTDAPVIGVDEVGRGCLAGPVYAGACLLKSEDLWEQLIDSKLLSEKRRDELAPQIIKSHAVELAFASEEEIDELNILQASHLAMERAILQLAKREKLKQAYVLIDGNQKIRSLPKSFKQFTLIKGDLRCPAISAAAIAAKVARDQLMRMLAKTYEVYGFEQHKGYGTKKHKEAITKWGPTPIHRKSFAGVKEFL